MFQKKNTQNNKSNDFMPKRKQFFYLSPLIKLEEEIQHVQQIQEEEKCKQQKLKYSNFQNQAKHISTATQNNSGSFTLNIFKQEKIKKNYLNDFIYQKTLGKGTFGRVEKLKYNNIDSYVAAKAIYKVPKQTRSEKGKLRRLQNQLQIYKQIKHSNFVQLLSVYEWKRQFTLIMELAQGNSLNALVRKHPNHEKTVAKIMYQIFDALQYLEMLNIVHRDIKAQNIVYDQNTQIIKIIDFGEALKIQDNSQMECLSGTYAYLAPEAFQYKFSHKTDMWACGVLLFYLLSAKLVFLQEGREKQIIKKNILSKVVTFQNNFWAERSNQVKELILKLLQKDPLKRISAKQAKNSLWIKQQIGNWKPPFLSGYQKSMNKGKILTQKIFQRTTQNQIKNHQKCFSLRKKRNNKYGFSKNY